MAGIRTSLIVPFAPGDTSKAGLSLELDRTEPVVGNPAGKAIIRQYPAVRADLFVSRGEVDILNNTVREYLEAEVVTFSQSTTAHTSKIMDTNPKIVKDWVFDLNTGRVAQVKFTPHVGTTLIEASIPITGGVIVTYRSSYREIEYTFETEIVDKTQVTGTGVIGDINMYSATMIAYYEGETATLELSPPSISDVTANENIELYKVTSRVVVNSEGVWEKPDNWPEDNRYDNYPSGVGPEVGSAYVEHERVHEVGMVDDFGRYTQRTFFTQARQPFAASINYKVPYVFSSSHTAQDLKDPSCAVNYGPIINRLKSLYRLSDEDIGHFGCY